MQYDLFGNITEIYVEQADIPFQFGISDRAVRLMRMAPRPLARALCAFGDRAVFGNVCVDERNIAFVRFRLFVQKFKDTAGARKAHDDRVDLHGDLTDVQGELTGHIEEHGDHRRADNAHRPTGDVEIAHVETDEDPRDDRRKHEYEMADIHDGGHQNVTVGIRLVGSVAQFVVDFIEIFLRALFVAENFDDLLPAHHLFDITFRFTDDFLLADKVARTAAADKFCHERHQDDAEQHDDHQP